MRLQDILLKLARAAIEKQFGKPFPYSKEILLEQFPELSQNHATFVRINIYGDSLHGCIGSLLPHAPLIDDVLYNAKAAAFGDTRFYPLTESEYPNCSIEISILTLPQELKYSDEEDLRSKIRPGIDGVILQLGERNATFLPQVWDEFPDFQQFFGQLGVKAGMKTYALNEHPRIFTYQVECFEDTPLEEAYIPYVEPEEIQEEEEEAAVEQSETEPIFNLPFTTPQEAEAGFYKALEHGNLDAMLSVWAENEFVECIHPGGDRLMGRAALEQSWREMLTGQPSMHFELEEVQYIHGEKLSVHTLRERIYVDTQLAGQALATNVYVLAEEGWRLLMHHASPDPAAWR